MKSRHFAPLIRRRSGLLFRGLLCWLFGLFLLTGSDQTRFDTRFSLRGNQPIAHDRIVILKLNPSDFFSPLWAQKEISEVTDSFFYQPFLWEKLLEKALQQNPHKIGVSLFFSKNLAALNPPELNLKLFQDSRIIWASAGTTEDRNNDSLFTNPQRTNIGFPELLREDDGMLRRFSGRDLDQHHFIERLLTQDFPERKTFSINYRGKSGRFPEINLQDLLEDRLPEKYIEGKILIIGHDSNTLTSTYNTPLGPFSRAEALATLTDNALENRWIRELPLIPSALFLGLVAVITVLIIVQYPQNIALVFLGWLLTFLMAISVYVFDRFNVWIPVFAPSAQILATWIIFLGYQANKMERKNYELEQERRALKELEQLKNNFVSLISHDLKTPIAKIQSVTDRLQRNSQAMGQFALEIRSLANSSQELNKYIQSILQVLRVESSEFQLSKEIHDLNLAIEDAVSSIYPLAEEKSIQIHTELEPLYTMEMDYVLIKEVMVNLIENAVKYSSANSSPIVVRSYEDGDFVHVEVQDHGAGISAEDLNTVFGKFVRGKDQDLKTKGTGLGLYLVKYFIELHGGSISLESQLGSGTKVHFKLPLNTEEDLESQHHKTTEQQSEVIA